MVIFIGQLHARTMILFWLGFWPCFLFFFSSFLQLFCKFATFFRIDTFIENIEFHKFLFVHSLFCIFCTHVFDDFYHSCWYIDIIRKTIRLFHDFLNQFFFLMAFPWSSSCQHLKKNNSYRKYITLEWVQVIDKNLWSHVERSSYI